MQRNEGNEVENVTRFVGKSGVVPRSRLEQISSKFVRCGFVS